MSTETLQQLIHETNQHHRTDAWIQLACGVLATLVVAVCVFYFFAYGSFFLLSSADIPLRFTLWIGAAATGVFLTAATWSAWHEVDPLRGVTVEDFDPDGPWLEQGARGQIAAFAAGIISGPRRLFEAWRSLRLTLPDDGDAIAQVEDLLRRCQGAGLPGEVVVHDQAYALARRLKLTKTRPDTDGEGERLLLTDKGRAVLMP